ncbi:LamG-like jellyroll fold domain-containing protein [Aliiroseovarius halocynthiae]|uniref:LamG-like jellyroll fold domain-containing protein n=1 Tax=Aliiroseovarius halocynthiae TaxID=985055 RepID=A0A545SLD5_9RHOB|nr:LamG-like jellyroll fold domain-containing protein [Aliiroseovarius halocynthiae]TQV65794.1 hypothetical protein FIL88_15975 [Aliiroseovarius halocynthiae]
MRLLIVFFILFTSTAIAESYEQEWGQSASSIPAWASSAEGSCKKMGLTVIPGMYYDGEFFVRAEQYPVESEGRLTATCYDKYDNTTWVELYCKITKDDGSFYRHRGYCQEPVVCNRCTEFGNPIDAAAGVKRENSVDWTSPKDARFQIERLYLSNGKLSMGWQGNANRVGHAGVWRSSFNELFQYTYSLNEHVFFRKDGSRIHYQNDADRTAVHPQDAMKFKTTGHWLYGFTLHATDKSGLTRSFDARWTWDRRLKGLKWPDGYEINIDWTDAQIAVVRDNKGQRAEYTWRTDTVPGSTRELISKIEIDTDYDETFTPELRIDYSYEPNVRVPSVPMLTEVTRTDLATGTSELAYRYSYLKDANDRPYYPLLLSQIYDGRLNAQGDPTLYAEFGYQLAAPVDITTGGSASGGQMFMFSTPFGTSIRPAISTTHVGANSYQVQLDPDDVTASRRRVINPLGHETVYDFTLEGDRAYASSEAGEATDNVLATTLSRDFTPNAGAPEGLVYAQVGHNGSRTTYERDPQGRILTKTEDADGANPRVTTYTWKGDTNLPATRSTSQLTETFSYTPEGLLSQYSQTDALVGSADYGKSRTWSYTYSVNAQGLSLLKSVDGPGLSADGVDDVVTYEYDASGNLTKTTDANQLETEIVTRDALGLPSLMRDPYGVDWAFSYDINGRVTSVERNPGTAKSVSSTYTYDPVGQLTSYTNFRGHTWSFEYDQARRMNRTVGPTGDVVNYTHDAMGNITHVEYTDGVNAADFWEDTEFDKLGRLLKTVGAEGQIWQYRHDVEDNLDRVTDPLNLTTDNSFDALNRLVSVADRAGYTSQNEHDDADQITEFTDQRAIDTDFVYNGFGEVLSEVSADRGTMSYTYNNRGLVSLMTDARGVVSTYEYDNGSRLIARRFPSDPAQDQTFSYVMEKSITPTKLDITQINGQVARVGTPILLASGAEVELTDDGNLTYSQNGAFNALQTGETATDTFNYSTRNNWGEASDEVVNVVVDGVTYPTPNRAIALWETTSVDIDDVVLPGEFTVEGWVKFPAGTVIRSDETLISDGTVDQSLNFAFERFRFWSQGVDRVAASTPATFETWTHYAITRDASGILRIYINGVLDATGSSSYTHPLTVGTIGSVKNVTAAQFDNLRVWSVARTEVELANNMNGHVPVNSPGLERYYAFDGIGDVAVDETGNATDAVMAGGTKLIGSGSPVTDASPSTDPTADYSGATDRVLELNDSWYVEVGDIALDGEFTIESWVKFPSGSTINYRDQLVSGQPEEKQLVTFNDGRFTLYSEGQNRFSASTPSPHNTWTHYALTRDATGVLRIYIDGLLDATSSGPYATPVTIRAIGGVGNYKTKAQFDNLRIWSVARTEAELASNMNGHVPVNSSGLERYYSFDGQGDIVSDETGSSAASVVASYTYLIQGASYVPDRLGVFAAVQNRTLSVTEGIDVTFNFLDEPLDLPGSGHADLTTDASGKSYVQFDQHTGVPITDFRQIEQHDYGVTYAHNAEGQITSITYPSGHVVAYTRDADERITDITVDLGAGPVSVISGASYLPNGPLTMMTYGDGNLHRAIYDNSYRLAGLQDGQGATMLRDATYTWTVRNNLAAVSDPINPGRNATYGYSPREFLANATGAWDTLDFTYDGVGNRLTRSATQSGNTSTDTYAYSSLSNRLQSITGDAPRSFTYDAAGNTTYDNRQGGGYGYTYDAANRMESFSINGVVQAEYVYNALGQQVIRRLPQDGRTIHTLFDLAGNRIAEYEVDPLTDISTLQREYIWMDGTPVAVIENGTPYFVRTDHIGRPVFATKSAGVSMWQASYLPFGGVHTTPGDPILLRFPGQWFQSESGLHQNWMRDYDPPTGRYIQAGPLGLVDGASVYGYALQNPGRYVDPRGENTAVIGGVYGSTVGGPLGAMAGALIGLGIGYFGGEALIDLWNNNSSEGGRANGPMPYGHGLEHEALAFPLNPFPQDPGSWYCQMLRKYINVLRTTIAWRYTDLNRSSASYGTHLRYIKKLEGHLKKMEANHEAVCGGRCYGP